MEQSDEDVRFTALASRRSEALAACEAARAQLEAQLQVHSQTDGTSPVVYASSEMRF